MVQRINFIHYKKLQNMTINFSEGINIISGTNGTCKTTLLHIISNSFQEINKSCSWINDLSCASVIKSINRFTNPKIEALAKGDKSYNDPANQTKGTLFEVDYYGHSPLKFRKHNSKTNERYAVKPTYSKEKKESLPNRPVIYLGIARLFPFAEFQDETQIKKINKQLPRSYNDELEQLYYNLSKIRVRSPSPQRIGDFKSRAEFISTTEGIDSNTISAGEDNLYILLTALLSLRYYHECITPSDHVASVLLVDELDATLHPSVLYKLLNLFIDYAHKYKIQIVCTSHSLTLLEFAFKKKLHVIYLLDHINNVLKIDFPDIYQIKMYLNNQCQNDIYIDRKIPIFTEDKEARDFLELLFDYFSHKWHAFTKISSYFYFVKAPMGAENLKNLFQDEYLLKSTMQSICILDGDQKRDLKHNILILPGDFSPEKVIMEYSQELFKSNDPLWEDQNSPIFKEGITKPFYQDNILPKIEEINEEIQKIRNAGKSVEGKERTRRKQLFNNTNFSIFFRHITKHWLNNSRNEKEIKAFFYDIIIMYKKSALYHDLNPNIIDDPEKVIAESSNEEAIAGQ